MIIGVQAVVPHDHAVDDVQFTIDLPEVVCAVDMAHAPGLLVPGGGAEEVQVDVDDLHGGGSFLVLSLSRDIIGERAGKVKAKKGAPASGKSGAFCVSPDNNG